MGYCGNSMTDDSRADVMVHCKVRTCRFSSITGHYEASSRQKWKEIETERTHQKKTVNRNKKKQYGRREAI